MGLIDRLEAFNRKERHILWEQATGTGQMVALSDSYRSALSTATSTQVPAAPEHFLAVDYHLNWVYGALLVNAGKVSDGATHPIPPPSADDPHGRRPYEHNQEDIDLLVAYEADNTTHVVMVEAKAFTAWGTKQMESKLRRLDRILDDALPSGGVAMHLVLTSFTPPSKLALDWGRWADDSGQPPWIPLTKPTGRILIEECDALGTRKQNGGHVHVIG